MDRLQVSGWVPAEIAERLSDRAGEFTDAELDSAAANICDDYLTCGRSYPDRKWGPRVNAGDYLIATTDEDDLGEALSVILYGRESAAHDAADTLLRYCGEGMKAWLLEKHEDMVRDRAEEIEAGRDE